MDRDPRAEELNNLRLAMAIFAIQLDAFEARVKGRPLWIGTKPKIAHPPPDIDLAIKIVATMKNAPESIEEAEKAKSEGRIGPFVSAWRSCLLGNYTMSRANARRYWMNTNYLTARLDLADRVGCEKDLLIGRSRHHEVGHQHDARRPNQHQR